ncbi:MAG: maltose ABC transporter substrate-binding protein [Treponema sp.]|nr:maltose ABC transporter substrate-binding protein [Treponema sp.]
MKKHVIGTAAVVMAAALCLSGCNKSEKKASAADKITLTVWESNLGPDEFIKQAGAAYTKANPNVEIKFVNVELGDACGQIALDGPAGVGPDLFAAPHDKLGELVTAGHVLETVNAEAVKKNVLGACSQALTYEGKMYGYPVSAETYALFYNEDLISKDEVPATWNDLEKWTLQFNQKNPGKYGFLMDVGNGYYTILFTTMKGNRLFGPAGTDQTKTYLNTAEAAEGMKYFQDLRSVLEVPAADLGTSVCDAAFQAGNAAMHITGLWNVKNFEDAGIKFNVAPIPALPGESTPASTFSGTRAMFVSAYTDYPEEAAKFAEFLTTPEMQKLRFDLTGAMPSVSVEVSSKYMPGFLKQLDYAFPMPSIPTMAGFWEAMNNASKNIWDGAAVVDELNACDKTILGL